MSTKVEGIQTLTVAEGAAIPFPTQHPLLICLSGFESAGKTRVAHSLEYAFKRQGIQVRYECFSGGNSTFAEILVRLFRRLRGAGDSGSLRSEGPAGVTRRRSRVGATLWYLVVAADLAHFCIFKVRLPLLLGKLVICDGYTFDTFCDIASRYERDPSSPEMNLFEKLFHLVYPRPDLHYLMLGLSGEMDPPGDWTPLQEDANLLVKTQLYLTRYQPLANFLVKKVDGDLERVEREIVRESVMRYWQGGAK